MSEPEYSDENTPERDYKTLVEEARLYARQLRAHVHVEHTGAVLVDRVADAIEALQAENEKLRENRGWDGEWRTRHQTEEEARRVLMSWTKAQLVNHHVAEWQRKVQNENWVADRLASALAERAALQAQLDAIQKYVRRVPFPKPDKILAILDPVEVKEEGQVNAGA